MILLLSQDSWEVTTEEVLDWIEALGGEAIRLNGEDLNGSEPFAMHYRTDGAEMVIQVDGRVIRPEEIGAVWWRRWHTYRNLAFVDRANDPQLAHEMRQHLVEELRATTRTLEILLGHAPWLSAPHERRVSKLEMLRRASLAGLEIPATLVTNDREALRAFMERHGRVIAKSVAEGRTFMHADTRYPMYTVEVRLEDVERAPPRFFPSLVQEHLSKAFEIRTFYLDGECHSMGIFSQGDAQTATDFRRYNQRRPNRNVPYRLPADVEAAVKRFMESVPLSTGSIDLVRTPDGQHVFLEVNPAGQFRMVSEPCNYRLEKRVAEYLIRKDRDAQREFAQPVSAGASAGAGARRGAPAHVPAPHGGNGARPAVRVGPQPAPQVPGVHVLPVREANFPLLPG